MQKHLSQEHAVFLRGHFPHTSIRKLRAKCDEHGIDIYDLVCMFNSTASLNVANGTNLFEFIEKYWKKSPLQFINGINALCVCGSTGVKKLSEAIIALLRFTNLNVENCIVVDCNLWHIKRECRGLANSYHIISTFKTFNATFCKYGYFQVVPMSWNKYLKKNTIHPFEYYINAYRNMCNADELGMQHRYLAFPQDAKIRENCRKKNAVMSHLKMFYNRMRMLFMMETENGLHDGNILLADIFIVKTICKYFWIVDEN